WKRHTEWPFIPITPTFPLLPVPLPTKWHLRVLPPIAMPDAVSPEAADDPPVVRRIGEEGRDRMQQALDAMRRRRRSVFFGSIFDDEDAADDPVGRPVVEVASAPTSRSLEATAP